MLRLAFGGLACHLDSSLLGSMFLIGERRLRFPSVCPWKKASLTDVTPVCSIPLGGNVGSHFGGAIRAYDNQLAVVPDCLVS